TELGGSFIQDYTPVFTVSADSKQYWRIETKDVYTGKGWTTSDEVAYHEQDNGQIDLQTFSDNVPTECHSARISYEDNVDMAKVVYPYGVEKINTAENITFEIGIPTEDIRAQANNDVVGSMPDYTVSYLEPSFDIAALKEVTGGDPDEISQPYTQL